MKTDVWVKRLNVLAMKMQEIEEMVHPSVWKELTQELRDKFIKLAREN